jgi:hypothetical protein
MKGQAVDPGRFEELCVISWWGQCADSDARLAARERDYARGAERLRDVIDQLSPAADFLTEEDLADEFQGDYYSTMEAFGRDEPEATMRVLSAIGDRIMPR